MDINEICSRLTERLGQAAMLGLSPAEEGIRDPFLTVQATALQQVAAFCRSEPDLQFDFCQSITGMDTGETFTCVYHLYSYTRRHSLVLKTSTPREAPCLPSCVEVWPAANWYEREVYDLYGIHFEGHPDLRRLLLPDDWPGHPMRKDWQEPAEYRPAATGDAPLEMAIPTSRESPLDLLEEEPTA